MLKIILNLLCISIIIVFITDITDFPNSVKKAISWVITKGKIVKTEYRLHLIDCSTCQLWWSGIIYLLIANSFTLPYIALVAVLACFSGVIKDTIILMRDICIKIIDIFYKWLG